MGVWRLLKHGSNNAFMNMAIDEAVLRARIDDLVPNTIRFYRWNPSAVSIGRFQKVREEVHLSNCKREGVDVVRRISGGGAVYHDIDDEVTYSVVAEKEDLDAQDIGAIYLRIYGGLVETLELLGLTADFSEGGADMCPNLMVDSKKISGSAQAHKRNVVLQHGTLLLDVDLSKMFTFLRVPWAKDRKEVVNIARNRLTSLEEGLEREVSIEEMEKALTEGFQKALNMELVEDELTIYELELAETLCREKYATSDWTYDGRATLELEGSERK